jgi:protein arginine N-methyltransferase 1
MSDNTKSATDKKSLPFSEQHYFSSYDHFGIHEEMLKDQVRTLSYRSAIIKNKDLFKDKIVLDVGCGTGILSMFAAQAGAKHVIAVDMSNIIEMAQKIVDLNGFSDKITLVKGKLEDVELPYKEVDIIISEWMGYFLLYESMLDTVLWARDHYLKEGGLIFPDRATMHIAGIEDGDYKEEKVNYWENVYGFDYSPFIPIAMSEPLVDTVENRSVVTTSGQLVDININSVKLEDLAFFSKFSLKAIRDDRIHGLVAWFDIWFPGTDAKHEVYFSTGPQANYTHWKQTVFYLDDVLDIKRGETIDFSLANRPNKINPRELDIEIDWDFKADGDDYRAQKGKHNYFLR